LALSERILQIHFSRTDLKWSNTCMAIFMCQLSLRKELQNIQGDQTFSVHLMIMVQKTRKNILNSFNHLPR
jgi:hypothetical protein